VSLGSWGVPLGSRYGYFSMFIPYYAFVSRWDLVQVHGFHAGTDECVHRFDQVFVLMLLRILWTQKLLSDLVHGGHAVSSGNQLGAFLNCIQYAY
jgi:hypothetical protein